MTNTPDIFWWHSIDFGDGRVTQGVKTPVMLAAELASLQLPDLSGKSVLDIGAWDGFYSFEAEKRGASLVVALDHFSWFIDIAGAFDDWRERMTNGTAQVNIEHTPHWQPDTMPGKRGFDYAHAALGSNVKPLVADWMGVDIATVGVFDVVFFLGVLYHMKNPLGALERLCAVTREVAIIETHAVYIPGYEEHTVCEFYPSHELNGDNTNWFGPNLAALIGMCRAAGFSRAVAVSQPFAPPSAFKRITRRVRGIMQSPPYHYRAVVHAFK